MAPQLAKTIGLALGGGALRGFAHLGVLQELEAARVPIQYVSGTSVGSLIGAIYCTGMDVQSILEMSSKLSWWKLIQLTWPTDGLFSFERMGRWLNSTLGELDIRELKIPFAAVATDMEHGEEIILTRGALARSVMASCAIPGLIKPVKLDGRILGDGSLVNTVPVSVLRDMGADYVIAVDIFEPKVWKSWGPLGWGFTALEIMVDRAGGGISQADCLIRPLLSGMTYVRYSKRLELMELGRMAAVKMLPQICADIGLSGYP